MTVELLPDNAFPIMRAVDAVNANRRPLPAWLVKLVDDPWTCPEGLLGYCAYHYSVDLWDEAWPTAKKRSVIAGALKLARIKGTEVGIAKALDIVGAKLDRVIAPPSGLFFRRRQTEAERAAYLARMPQLRIYPRRVAGAVPGFYPGRGCLLGVGCARFMLVSEAPARATPRITLWRAGVETELTAIERRYQGETVTEAEENVEARARAPFRGMMLSGFGPWFATKSTAKQHVYRVHTRQALATPNADRVVSTYARPSQEPIDVRPAEVREQAPYAAFYPGRIGMIGAPGARFMLRSRARNYVFKRVYLYEPGNRNASPDGGAIFPGVNFRFGMPAYTAELRVKVRVPRHPAAFKPFTWGFLLARDASEFRRVVEAVRTHQSLRDRIVIDTATAAVITAGSVTASPDRYAGQIVDI